MIGPVATSEGALAILGQEHPDLAILDINLGHETAFPVFDCLERAGMPFIILSGHSRHLVPARHRHRPFVQKPYSVDDLLKLIHAQLIGTSEAWMRTAC